MFVPIRRVSGLAALGLAAALLVPTLAQAGGPPQAATAFQEAVIGPDGGSISGFGLTATFAPGAVSSPKLIILGNWPNGLDVPPPNGETAVKTFGLQQCNADGTNCTSVFGNFPTSPAGTEKIHGQDTPYTAFQPGVAYGSAAHKLVTISIETGGDKVYVYNANFGDTARAYPKLLPSVSGNGTLTFQTFQPIVWVVTTPAGTP
ncbi:MAG: hypothetical protein NVSMB65_15150 [Chloroflexota bacterium]